MAVLKFRIYWEEDETVYRDVVVKHKQTFFDLHLGILKSYAFDNKHAATFYKSNDAWQMGREISLEKYPKTYKVEPLIMQEVPIGTEIADPNQKFIYEYDFTKNWRFLVELIGIEKEENPKWEYPSCIRTNGIGPSQYGAKGIIESRMAEMEEKYDLRPDALSEGFNQEGDGDAEQDGNSQDQESDALDDEAAF
ncbi:MAG: IS1096 element passenger TnpR family protein [Ferruginibacter sp.]